MEWVYYHYGRYSFSTPGWWLTVKKGKNPEALFLKLAEKNKLQDIFVPWTKLHILTFRVRKPKSVGLSPLHLLIRHLTPWQTLCLTL